MCVDLKATSAESVGKTLVHMSANLKQYDL